MATLNVCSRLSRTLERFQVSLDLGKSVECLQQEIRKQLDPANNKDIQFDIIYCGQVLAPATNLSSYMLQSHSTVYVVRKFSSRAEGDKPQHSEGTDKPPESVNKSEVTMAVRSALLNPEYRNIVESLLNDPKKLEEIISATPGLDQDPSVLAMLQEPELLAILAHRNNLDSLLQHHPCFAQAAIAVTSAVREEDARRGNTGRSTGILTYSMDQMSDEEDDAPMEAHRLLGNPGTNITTSQLAAAIQAVTGSGSMGGSGSFPPMPSTSQGAPGPSSSSFISNDFFQQAMAHAQSASSDAALQQLREMGITDENVARQALAATGGDIQAAIDLIFGDGMM
ncbi:ubiquitin-like protein 7 [Plakobranchus ocellatus]|uniref:Ubiquitin-like protein 7 n=1 Tax=Plakobranchus ocellatus TaxID=259542 RepID=A0AAV4B2T8_9GAST|nr:ubiquitin-like protein 7 [Plakobranchus ocellatus]